jgi:hypothetical protein
LATLSFIPEYSPSYNHIPSAMKKDYIIRRMASATEIVILMSPVGYCSKNAKFCPCYCIVESGVKHQYSDLI